jgi:ATP-dependent RNA helicase DDX49/DBP8
LYINKCHINQSYNFLFFLLATRPHIVIATPGRLADHLESCKTFSLKKIKYLVLDEADRLLEESGGGFAGQLKTIFDNLPSKKQTLLFSATITESMEELRTKINMNDQVFKWEQNEQVDDTKTVENLKQSYVLTPVGARDAYLVMIVKNFVEKLPLGLIVIFAKTCKSVQLLSMTLTKSGFPAEALHSGRLQKERMAALSTFRSCQVKILVATDVASRGLDIPQVQLVINHNVPSVTKDYIHR